MIDSFIRTIILCAFLLTVPFNGVAFSEVVFQDDFENDPSDWVCTDGELSNWSSGYGRCGNSGSFGPEWKMDTGHNSNNSVGAWKHSSVTNNYWSESNRWLTGDDVKTEVYHRWYMKWPAEFDKAGSSGMKFWRYITRENGYSLPLVLYLNVDGSGGAYSTSNLVLFYKNNVSGKAILAPVGDFNDGEWHCHELRIKLNSNGQSDGVIQYWLDGALRATYSNISLGTTPDMGIHRFGMGIGNASDVAWPMSDWTAVSFDDVVLSTTPVGPIGEEPPTPEPPTPEPPTPEPDAILFQESFENNDLAASGWYDNTNLSFSTTEKIYGARSAEFHFSQGEITPDSGGAIRHQFDSSESVYVSFWIKYSSNWQEQVDGGHHEFYLLTTEDGDWSNLAFTHLTGYIENHDLYPVLTIQDGANIDQNNIGVNLVSSTEDRSVAGCNGDSDGYGDGSCYNSGDGTYWNGKVFKSPAKSITPGQWHKVEAYFKLNSISNGKGVADGVIQYWLDGNLQIDNQDVMIRTGLRSTQKFNQFVIAPFMGHGSPVSQTFWLDNLIVLSSRPTAAEEKPNPPSQFQQSE